MKRVKILLFTLIMAIFLATVAYAATGVKITFSDPAASAGEEVSVKMKISSSDKKLGSTSVMLSYDTAYLEFTGGDNAQGGAGSLKLTGDSSLGEKEQVFNFKFKALKAGTTSITIKDDEIKDANANVIEPDHRGSSSVKISGEADSSVNANLSSLEVYPGTLTPAFSPEVSEYTVLVGGDCDKIAVHAPTSDTNASVVISGNDGLQIGDNEVICKVTAQDGSSKEYKITVTKQEGIVEYGESGRVSINGNEYDVAGSFDETLLPEGFTAASYNYNGRQVLAGTDPVSGITIMYLISEDGYGDFFIYDATSDTWSQYAKIYVSERSVTVLPLPGDVTVPEGFTETTLDLDGKKVKGWIWAADTDQKYCIVYGVYEGDRDFYRYDLSQKTIQRYFADPSPADNVSEEEYVSTATMYNELVKDYNAQKYIMYALAAAAAVLLVALIIVLIASKNGSIGSGSRKMSEREYERERTQRAETAGRVQRVQRSERDERHIQQKQIRKPGISEEEKLQRSLAREVRKAQTRPAEEDDDFETFDL